MVETLENRIIRHEGIRLNTYSDSRGYLSIGVGRNLENGIRTDEAMLMLNNDIEAAQDAVTEAFPWSVDLSPIRQEVLVEMCFQLGMSGLKKFVNMLTYLQAGNYQAAANEMLNSAWHTQTPARCNDLASLMISG